MSGQCRYCTFPARWNITAAACFKAQRVVRDGWIVVTATAAGVGPVGVDGGICMEYGIRRDLCSAALFGVPAVEAVTAASGGAGREVSFRSVVVMLPTEGVPPLPSKVTMNSVGAGGASFSKMALTSTLPSGMVNLLLVITSPAGDSTCHP